MFGADTGLIEFVLNVRAVFDADSEDDGPAALAVLLAMLDDVADESVRVHPAFELTDNVVALLDPHASGDVDVNRRIDPGSNQESADDQIRDLRALDHRIEDVAEPLAVAPARCCRHAGQV